MLKQELNKRKQNVRIEQFLRELTLKLSKFFRNKNLIKLIM